MDLDDNKFQHLEALLDQTTMYSNFLAEQMEGIDEDDRRPKKKVKKAQEKVSEPASADGEVSETKKLLPMMNVEMRDYQLKGFDGSSRCTRTVSTVSWRTRWVSERRCRRSVSCRTCDTRAS